MKAFLKTLLASTRRLNAWVLALSFIPFFFTREVALELMALRVLRFGPAGARGTLGCMTLVPLVLLCLGRGALALLYLLMMVLPTFSLAALLANRLSWQRLVEGFWIAMIVVWGIISFALPEAWGDYLFNPFWQAYQLLTKILADNQLSIPFGEYKRMILVMLCFMTFYYNLILLGIARAIQAWLYHPGGFVAELKSFRLSMLSIGCMGFAILINQMGYEAVGKSLLLLSLMPMALLGGVRVGLGIKRFKVSAWLVAPAYIIIFIVGLPMSYGVIALVGVVDTLMKFGRISYASHITRKSS